MSTLDQISNQLINEIQSEFSVYDLLQYKRRLETLMNLVNDKLRCLCIHEWETDYVENPYSSVMTKIRYCKHCESSPPSN